MSDLMTGVQKITGPLFSMATSPHILPDLLAGLLLIIAGSALFTRSIESTVERFFDNKGLGLRVLGNLSLSLPELILPLFAFLAPNVGSTAIDAGTGALFGPPIFLFLFLVPLVLFIGRPSIRTLLAESPVLFLGLALALLAMGKGMLLRLVLATVLTGLYLWTLLRLPSDQQEESEEPRDNSTPPPFRIRDGIYLVAGTLLMTFGSHIFLTGIDLVSRHQGSRAFWIALVLTPFATEAPELLTLIHFLRKRSVLQSFSILWGSIHFQMTVSIASGLVASPWKPSASSFVAGSALLSFLVLSFTLGRIRRTVIRSRAS